MTKCRNFRFGSEVSTRKFRLARLWKSLAKKFPTRLKKAISRRDWYRHQKFKKRRGLVKSPRPMDSSFSQAIFQLSGMKYLPSIYHTTSNYQDEATKISAKRLDCLTKGHPLSMDPGPQTQLRTQNAKRVFHRRGPPRGPPRTQLRRKFQGTKSF